MLLASALLALASTLPGQREVTVFRDAFRPHGDPDSVHRAREAALAALGSLDSAAIADALVRAYECLENECAPLIGKRRELLPRRDVGPQLQKLRDQIEPLWSLEDAIGRRILGLQSREARAAIGQHLDDKRLPLRLRLVGARVAAALFDAERMPADQRRPVEELLVILEAARSLERAGQPLGRFALTALDHAEASVRRRGIETLEALCWPDSLRPLIDHLEREIDLGLRARTGDALAVLTKQPLGASPVAWRGWLEQEGGPYLRGERRLGGGRPQQSERRTKGYYFGIPIDQPSVLFVQDNSNSMREPSGGRPRIDKSRAELRQALDALQPAQRFNVMLFADRIWMLDKGQVAATPQNVERAKAWLDGQGLELGTSVYDALEQSFVLAGRGVDDRFYEPQIDAVFLLSDGAPTVRQTEAMGRRAIVGGRDDPQRILAAVDRWNLFDRVQVHCILLGGGRGPASEFMQELARQNGGRFALP